MHEVAGVGAELFTDEVQLEPVDEHLTLRGWDEDGAVGVRWGGREVSK